MRGIFFILRKEKKKDYIYRYIYIIHFPKQIKLLAEAKKYLKKVDSQE